MIIITIQWKQNTSILYNSKYATLDESTKQKTNLTFEDQKPHGSSGSTSNYWM